ncbi:MAG: hypothetical protein LBN22_10075, partial [Clostridiales Family XIII bacterium]|nr:hypothetical protein [Clostridiales Family XIII bacterium]
MAKKQKTTKSEKQQMNQTTTKSDSDDYLLKMSYYEGRSYKLQMIPATFFTAFVIMITRMYTYNRDMSQFFWTNQSENLTDFFSHYKLVAIVICAIVALLMLLFRFITQSLYIVRSKYYIPALVYVVFVLLSLAFSKYHNFAWFGANDRFDGTLAILCYFVLFFYIINTINSRTSLKWLLYPLCASVILLSLLGLTQALDVDFFRTTLGQKLLVPNVATEDGGTTWALIDQAKQNGELFLKFTFQNKEIYQTVYNINYVSYYLTLLVPLFAFLFLRENSIPKKVFWGFMELCVMFNILGASSSGGLVGLAVAFFVTIFVFNKTLLKWWKNLIVLFVIIAIAAIPTASHWIPDIASGLGVENPFSKDMPKSASEEGATASADNADTAKSG